MVTPVAVLLPLAGALAAYALRERPEASAAAAVLTPLASLAVLLWGFATAPGREVWWSVWIPGFLPGVGGVGFVMMLDGLSAAMCVMTCVLYSAAMLYALPYLCLLYTSPSPRDRG